MKHTNKGYIGKPKLVSDDGKFREGVWEISDVYKGRLNDDKVLVARNMQDRDPERWATKDEDPYYDTVRVHLTQPNDDHIMRDRSQYNNCDDLILDQHYRFAGTSFFGPRYSHWSTLFGENGYYRLNENNNQLQFGTDPFTIEFWIKRHRNDNTNHFIMGFGDTAGTSGGSGMAIYITSSNVLAFVNATTSNTISGFTNLQQYIDEWIHVACVRTSTDTNGFKIYINGSLDAIGTCGNFHPTNSTNFYIGRDRVATQATGFWGRITDIRITKSAIYTEQFARPTAPLDMTIPNVIYHDSLTNRRFYSDYSNGPGVPVLLDSSQTVKVIDSPFFTEVDKTSQAHGTHSAYLLDRNRIHKYLDIKPANTSLRLGTGPFTIEGWIYMDERATNNAICGKGTNTNGWSFWIDSSFRLRFTSFATEHYKTDAVTNNYVVYGGWHHVAAVREGTGANQFKLYVNGKLEYTGTNSDDYTGQDPLYVFAHRDGTSYVANGYQCGIRISGIARYTSNFDVSTTAFIDNSMTNDNDVRFLTATCGTTKLMPTQGTYIDYGKARVPQVRKGNELRWGQHHPTSNNGFSFSQTDQASRALLKSNANYYTWTKADNYTWSKVDSGLRHMVGIQSNGTLWAWGENHYGQLGLGDQMTRTVPTQIGTDTDWAHCSAGAYFTLAIKTNGTLWTWGFNNYGQLGHNDGITRLVPRQVGTATNWREAWAGQYWDVPLTVAVKTDNTMWAWGRNAWSGFSNGTSNNSSIPVQGGNSTADWSRLFTGWYNHLGIKTDGTLWAWGYNNQGQYGVGNGTWVSSAINVGGAGNTYIWAACGREYNLAIRSNGTLWGAGTGTWGNIGQGTGGSTSTWTQAGTATNWIRCWITKYTSYALNSDGELWAWGDGVGGLIGDGKRIQYWTPIKVAVGATIDNNYSTRGGENWMCLLDTAGGRRVVGGNQFGQLGITNDDSAFNWGTGDFSLEFWVRRIWDQDAITTSAPGGYILMSGQRWWNDIINGDTQTWSIKSVVNTNYLVIYCGGETVLSDTTGNAPITINNWVHFCWQRTNGFMCLYANGKKVSERYYPHKIAAQWNEITALCDTTPYRYHTTGLYGFMSDIRINKGTAAYSKNNVNPPEIEVPTAPLVPVTGTVFHTACGPVAMDYSGQTTYFNEVRNDGNREMPDFYAANWSCYITSSGPYNRKNDLEHNDISNKIRSYGDTWDGTNWSESRSYWPTPANQYPEFSWISRMVKPWTIEFWFYGHQHYAYNGAQTNHRKLYTAISSGHEGWEIWYGRDRNDQTGGNPVAQKWGTIMFGLWTVGSSTRQTFGSTDASTFRTASWNHCAIVFDPTKVNKMAIFLNGKRVGEQTTQFTGGTKTYNTYYLQNETVGQGAIHISDSARYNNDLTTYTIPFDGWKPDNNTVSLTNSESPNLSTKTGMNQMTYGVVPNYTQKKFGRGSFKFQGLDQTNGVGPDRIQWSKNTWAIYDMDMRQKDITIECWAQWWDQPIGSISFNGSQGFRLPSTGTLNQTDGTVEFWIKAATTQQANATIIDGTTNNTGSFIGITNGKLVWSIKRDTHALITSKTTITDNQWHHIVCVKYQQSGVRSDGFLYVDGKLEGKSVAWVGSTTWNFSDGQIGRSRYNTGTDAGYAFTGLLCNFHYHNNVSKYMSTWNRFGTTSTEGRWAPNTYASGTWNPIPVNYQNPSVSELDSNAAANSAGLNGGAGSTYLDYETGKIQVPKGPIPRLNSTVLLLNAESTTGAPGAGVTQLLSGQSIVYYGVAKDDSGNNFALTAAGTLPTRSTELPWYGGGSWETIAGRPLKTQEVNYGSTLFNYSGGPHVWRTEDGFWAMSYTSDFLYDQTYPRRLTTIRSNIRAKNRSEGPDAFQHVCLQRSAHDFILWIDGVEAGRFTMSMQGAWDRPYQNDNQAGDYSNTYIQLGTHSNGSWQRGWCGYIHDFRVSMIGRYQSNVINGVSTMCHRNTVIPAVPTAPFPTSK